jgi:hypothetical protein
MNLPNGYNSYPDFQFFHALMGGAKTTGSVFYVHSGTGTDGAAYGSTPDAPFASIDYAIGKCTASKGDVILVMPGHTEIITGTDITVDVAGVSVIGLGQGSLMPWIKHNHADAEVSISADNVTWQGIRHSADVTSVKVAIEIEDGADFCTVKGCLFDVVLTGTDEFLVSIRTNDASNNATIEGNHIDMGAGGAVSGISFTKDTDSTKVLNNVLMGDFSTACINGLTTKSTKLLIKGNVLVNGYSDDIGTEPGIELVTASSGVICDNYIVCNLNTVAASIVADTCMCFQNYYNEDVSSAGTGGIIGTPSAND